MPSDLVASTAPVLGLEFSPKTVRVINSTSSNDPSGAAQDMVRGDVVAFDILNISTLATTFATGGSDSVWANFVECDNAVDNYGPVLVLSEDIAIGKEGNAILWGPSVAVQVNDNSGSGQAIGQEAGWPDASPRDALRMPPPTTGKVLAISHEAVGNSATVIVQALFNGWNGLGLGT